MSKAPSLSIIGDAKLKNSEQYTIHAYLLIIFSYMLACNKLLLVQELIVSASTAVMLYIMASYFRWCNASLLAMYSATNFVSLTLLSNFVKWGNETFSESKERVCIGLIWFYTKKIPFYCSCLSLQKSKIACLHFRCSVSVGEWRLHHIGKESEASSPFSLLTWNIPNSFNP